MPAIGSALDMGHKYLEGLFLDAASTFAAGTDPVEVVEAFVNVDDVDEMEDKDEDEFVRVATFLVGMSIRETSSALIAGKLLDDVLDCPHACLLSA